MPMAELMLVLFGLLVIVTPFITLGLLVKYNKLRTELDQLKAEHSKHLACHVPVAERRKGH